MTALRIDSGPLCAARAGGPGAAAWGAGLVAAMGAHALAGYLALQPPAPPPEDGVLDVVPIELGPPAPPPAGRIEDPEPPAPEPEPDPEPEEEPAPEPDVLTERAVDAPPPAPTAPPPRPAGPPQRLSSAAASPGGGEPQQGYGYGGELSLEEFRMVAAYLDAARAHFIREVRYPEAALRRDLEGTGMLLVVVGKDGRVVQSGVQQSTGHVLLDSELERLLRRLRRLDPLPEAFPRQTLSFRVPVQFQIYRPD